MANTTKNLNFATSEALKEIRTNLLYGNNKVIGFTSMSPSEGKSTMTIQLAKQFALLNKKVIVVECDLKRPVLHKTLLVKKSQGISEYLTNQTGEIINGTSENFDIIFAGNVPPNSTELLSSDKFSKLISKLKNDYDYVLVDTPPVLGTIDAQIIGGVVDGMVFVVRSRMTKTEELRKGILTFKQRGINIIGSILNREVAKKNGKGYYYYYYYGEKNK